MIFFEPHERSEPQSGWEAKNAQKSDQINLGA